jgi:glutathione S-transferase
MSTRTSSLILYHHPFSRAATVLWMLEEIGQPYELRFVDLRAGEQRHPEFRKLNPMGKVPLLLDGDTIITEVAAIGLYLADRYALGTLAPRPDEAARGPYFRWSMFPSAVIEPAAMAKASSWEYRVGQAGFGDFESMSNSIEVALEGGPWLLGDRFSMADVIFGSTIRYLQRFKMLEATSATTSYVERLSARPASLAADAKNKEIIDARGLAS